MQLRFSQLIDSIGAGGLRYQKPRRVEQEAVVDPEFAADRRLNSQSEPDRVRPQSAKIVPKCVGRGSIGRIEQIADPAKNISAIIKRDRSQSFRQRNSRFKIHDR